MQDLIITNRGQELIAKMIAGTSTASFTKIQTSSYDYSTEMLKELTFLSDVKQETLISSVTRIDGTMVEVIGAINNSELSEGYYVKALGLFAKDIDGNEILYAVCVEAENPDYMPAFGGKTVSGITYKMNTKVDISSQVTLEISPAAVPTMEQVDNLTVSVRSHVEVNIYGEMGVHGMRYFNDELQVKNETGEWTGIETGSASEITSQDIIIPTSGWENSKDAEINGLSVDVPVEGVTETMIPIVAISPAYDATAKACELNSRTKTVDGSVRFYAQTAPEQPITVLLTLLSPSGNTASGKLQPATKDRLGGVIIGDGVAVTAEGKISVATEDISATDADADDIINSIFGN